MGKSVRNFKSPSKDSKRATNTGKGVKNVGGKNLSLYMNQGFNLDKKTLRGRRFSIMSSSSEDIEGSNGNGSNESNGSNGSNGSDSDSSLTAVSDNAISDRSSVFGDKNKKGKSIRGKGKGKSIKAYGKKIERKYWDEEEEEDSDSSNESEYSSSDDENVDFVKLQAQKKIRSMTPVAKVTKPTKNRRDSVPQPKYGRRRSTAALPEDINFKLEFNDNYNDNAIDDSIDESDNDNDNEDQDEEEDESEEDDNSEDMNSDGAVLPDFLHNSEEDLGEEIDIPQVTDTSFVDLEFTNQIVQAPKFNEDDINSDDDYEIDDNELLATLQADNDLEEFNQSGIGIRQNSVVSADEDDEENEFLKEEEKFLVNEFESNGFDDDITNEPISFLSGDEEDEEDDEIIDFTLSEPVEDGKYPKKSNKASSDSEDDSYLWNYFFSSDNDSENEGKGKDNSPMKTKHQSNNFIAVIEDDQEYDSSESTDIDLNIPSNSGNILGSQKAKEVLSSKTADYRPPILGTWVALESKPFGIIDGLSTRSLTSHHSPTFHRSVDRDRSKPRKSVVGTPHAEGAVLGLDDLLNMSELDYDDTDDARIWRDFNNNKKRVPLGAFRNKSLLQNSVHSATSDPLTSNISYNHTSKTNNDFNQRRYSLSNHHDAKVSKKKKKTPSTNQVPSKVNRRRASKVEALAEGYRPTRSGLFSEQALIDVEEVLGDDNDIMALIKGL